MCRGTISSYKLQGRQQSIQLLPPCFKKLSQINISIEASDNKDEDLILCCRAVIILSNQNGVRGIKRLLDLSATCHFITG